MILTEQEGVQQPMIDYVSHFSKSFEQRSACYLDDVFRHVHPLFAPEAKNL